MKSIIFLVLISVAFLGYAQTDSAIVLDGKKSSSGDFENLDMPEFVGGAGALFMHLQKNLNFPQEAKDNHVNGAVKTEFTVDSLGNIKDVKVLEGLGYGCDEAAIAAIKSMPKWTPGKKNGKPVEIKYTLPVRFQSNSYNPSKPKPKPNTRDAEADGLLEAEQYKEALQQLKTAYRGNPTNHSIHLQMGVAKLGLGKTEAACKSFEKALELGSNEAKKYIAEKCK